MKKVFFAVLAVTSMTVTSAYSATVSSVAEQTLVSGGAVDFVTALSAPGECDAFNGRNCDGALDIDVYFDWFDGDTFDIGFTTAPMDSFSVSIHNVVFLDDSAVGLDFLEDGPHETFLASSTNPGGISGFVSPTWSLSNLNTSFTINFRGMNAFGADAPSFRFDVLFDDDQAPPAPSEVPLPASGLLLAGGLGVLALRRRRANH